MAWYIGVSIVDLYDERAYVTTPAHKLVAVYDGKEYAVVISQITGSVTRYDEAYDFVEIRNTSLLKLIGIIPEDL